MNNEVPDSSDVGKVRALIAQWRKYAAADREHANRSETEIGRAFNLGTQQTFTTCANNLEAALLGSGAAPLREKTET